MPPRADPQHTHRLLVLSDLRRKSLLTLVPRAYVGLRTVATRGRTRQLRLVGTRRRREGGGAYCGDWAAPPSRTAQLQAQYQNRTGLRPGVNSCVGRSTVACACAVRGRPPPRGGSPDRPRWARVTRLWGVRVASRVCVLQVGMCVVRACVLPHVLHVYMHIHDPMWLCANRLNVNRSKTKSHGSR